jgi:hypothetical protein
MSALQWLFLGQFVLNALVMIPMIGKDRAPMPPAAAGAWLLINLGFLVLALTVLAP